MIRIEQQDWGRGECVSVIYVYWLLRCEINGHSSCIRLCGHFHWKLRPSCSIKVPFLPFQVLSGLCQYSSLQGIGRGRHKYIPAADVREKEVVMVTTGAIVDILEISERV